MKIIDLKGSSDAGKTTTLNYLIDVMQIVSSAYDITFCKTDTQDEKDRRAWFDYKGYRIGICTSGDSKETIDENFKYCQKNCCDIAVIASRIRGQTIEKLYNLARYHMCEIKKLKINSVEEAKEKTIELLNEVMQIVEEKENS